MTKPGIYPKLSFDEYLAIPAVNASLLCTVAEKTPGHAKYEQEYGRPDSKAMQDGRNVHLILLEPDSFADRVKVLPPDPPRRPS
jgi:hypothetical protein